jgi:hypothetical protein
MDRIEQLRAARASPQVVFVEYLKLRTLAKNGLILVFEGKDCPTFYVGRVNPIFRNHPFHQIIARGKKNVLGLRDLVLRNIRTSTDKNIYFVDRDFDDYPAPGDEDDVYVTRGYSIENELVDWAIVEPFIKANFDIADSDDSAALLTIGRLYRTLFEKYLILARDINQVVYLCRKTAVKCIAGDNISTLLEINWEGESIRPLFNNYDELFRLLHIQPEKWDVIKNELPIVDRFSEFDRVKNWRGKYHFSFLRRFLILTHSSRLAGKAPFSRSSKINVDPSHPSLFGLLSAFAPTSDCLQSFINRYVITNCEAT